MAESVGRGSRGRRGRISSNASSARSSAILDDHLHPGLHSSQALRPVESRFSLNEQFAATRKDYEFGYDDASSVLDRASAADYKETDDTVVLDDLRDLTDGDEAPSRDCILSDRSFYELLCLPPTAAASPTEIRRAYYRLLQEIHPETQPQSLVPLAEALLNVVQTAFETLIEPHRKANYDMSLVALESEVDVFDEFRDAAISADGDRSYVDRLAEEYLNLTGGEIRTTTDLGLRLRPRSRLLGYARDSSYRRWATVDPVDFSLQQATTLNLAALNRGIQTLLDATTNCGTPGLPKGAIYCASTTATVTASIHGLMDGPFRLASLVFDRYQPPGPPLQGRRRLTQLLASRYLPLLNVKVRQEFVPDSEVTKQAKGRSTVVVEEEVDCLPVPAVTVRASRSFDLADGTEPLDVEISVTRILLRGSRISSMGLAAHKHVGDGTAFVAIDAGNWELWPAHESSRHPRFSKIVKRFSQAMTPFRSSPTVEVGYNVGSYPMGLRAGRAFTKPGNRGIRGMDIDMDDDRTGSWTASLGATTDTVAAYVSHTRCGIRTEAELSSTVQRDFFLAFRALKRVGRFSKIGFEMGVSPSNLHLSLYWSRLGQRISIPFLLASATDVSTGIVFWATIVPFLTFAAMEFLYWRPRPDRARRSRRRGKLRLRKHDGSSNSSSSISSDSHTLQLYISRHRAEADKLTALLANNVELRQRAERQRGGLVILSAKYGIRGAPPEEIADVTVAVAALVDGGSLVIPAGLRKSHLLGFWDPAPGKTKVLSVRYMYQGAESAAEVAGGEEFRLP